VRHCLVALKQLSTTERRLLLRAWALLLLMPLRLRFVPLPRLVRRRRPRHDVVNDPQRIAWLVSVAARFAPGARCLPVALVTASLLARQGTPATLRIGVARRGGRFAAHAWLDCNGAPLLDASEAEGFTSIVAMAIVSS
jgi:Transglutaminase-like superfamily